MVEIPPCESLIELEDVLVTAGGSELALTGGDGQGHQGRPSGLPPA